MTDHDQTESRSPRVVLVVAVADNGVIGHDGDIPWSIPEDLKHFREVTSGHTVLMGRNTFESIGRPLPNRKNVVLTRDQNWTAEGVTVVHDLPAALAEVTQGDAMVIGGAQIYAEALPLADQQIITEVHQSPRGDTHYPEYPNEDWQEFRREPHDGYEFVWLQRR
ncbi:MAG TPA: dihydrofolate reductase [Marmoricola sp.]|nr:dihydrofolate reductase [Marmoricola sp.]